MPGSNVSTKNFAKSLGNEINRDNVYNGAAALGFFMMLALFPAMIFLLSLLPYLPIANLQESILGFIQSSLPQEAYKLLSQVVNGLMSQRHGGLLSFGLLGTLWATTSGLVAIMRQLNATCKVEETRSMVKIRGVSLLLTLAFILLLVCAFALIVFGNSITQYLASTFGWSQAFGALFTVFRWLVIFLMIVGVFALTYYMGPNTHEKFHYITPGSVAGAVLAALATWGFSLYVSHFGSYDKMYGTLGSVITLMMWLYILGFVLLLGAEINQLAHRVSAEEPQRAGTRNSGGLRPARI